MSRKLLVVLLILAGIWIAGVTFLQADWAQDTLNVSVIWASPAYQQLVTFRYPRALADGEQDLFEMTIAAVEAPTTTPGGPVLLEGRLEMAGVDLFPAESLRVPYHAGQTVSFRWLVTAHGGTPQEGTMWLVAVGVGPGGQETRFPMIARPIQVEVRQVLGLSFFAARWLGAGLILVGLICALWLRNMRNK